MEVPMVKKQINGDGVLHGNLYDRVVGGDDDGLAFDRDLQVLDDLENIVANLFFRVAINDRKTRLLLHLVGQLIRRYINRHKLDGGKDGVHHDCEDDDGLEFAFPSLGAAVHDGAAILYAQKLHGINLLGPVLRSGRPWMRTTRSILPTS